MSLHELIQSRAPVDRSSVALEQPGGAVWTFDDLDRAAARAAGAMRAAGLSKGDRVAVQTEKSPETLAIYLGCLRAGLVFLPMNTAYRAEEMAHILSDAEPSLCIGDPAKRADLEAAVGPRGVPVLSLNGRGGGSFAEAATRIAAPPPPEPCGDEDLAAILYTSGTTGRPKGAMLSHGNLAANGLALAEAWAFTADDVLLHALPIFHVHGLFVACHCALLTGAKMIWLRRFDAGEVLAHLPRATSFMGVPTYYTRLLERPDFTREAAAHMRLFTSGSAPLLTETFDAFAARTGQTIVERYGMTETGINTSNPYRAERRAGTVGFPLQDVALRIVSEGGEPVALGETGGLEVRGPNVFSGYWRRPDLASTEFAEGGWFRTGDIARTDADGYLHLVGRAKDLIISGGYNVYPKEIEALIDDLPGVEESAVVGVPHPDFGEAGVAVVVAEPGAALEPEAILASLREKLANYKVPKCLVVAESLPRNVMGKVQKAALRKEHVGAFTAVKDEPARPNGECSV